MATRVRVGKFYRVTDRNLFDILAPGSILNVGDIVQVVNPPGIRMSGSKRWGKKLRHVMNKDKEITFCSVENLEPV